MSRDRFDEAAERLYLDLLTARPEDQTRLIAAMLREAYLRGIDEAKK
jgi:hypothetical protein